MSGLDPTTVIGKVGSALRGSVRELENSECLKK